MINILSEDILVEIWRTEGIHYLVRYPEKTDRLEAAAAAGKTGPLVLFWRLGKPAQSTSFSARTLPASPFV